MFQKKRGLFTSISVLLTISVYAMVYGWKFALALVYILVLHESGHLIAAKRKGIPTSPAIFIPFLGAVIGMKEKPKDAETEAFIAYGGPFFGMLAFLPAIPLYLYTKDPFWGLVIYLGSMLNLFNLFPVSPLDGGRIVSVLSPKVWLIGLIALVPLLFLSPDPILFLIFILGIFTWLGRLGETKKLHTLEIQKQIIIKKRIDLENFHGQLLWNKEPADKIRLMNESLYQWDHRLKELERMNAKDKEKTLEIEFEKQFLRYILSLFHSYWLGEELFQQAFREMDKTQSSIDKKLNGLQSYYQTTSKVKWKWIGLYLGLALVLILTLVYGINIMETNPSMFN